MNGIENNHISEVEVVKRNRFLTVWLIPLAATAVGLYLLVQNIMQSGIPITITFSSGNGIVAGETLIKYGGVEIGIVDSIRIKDDKTGVIVTATMKRSARDFTREGSQFWLVGPRVSLAGVTGLDTILSGQYLTVKPGEGDFIDKFNGLDRPPFRGPDAEGLKIVLETEKLGSVSESAPILFREIQVGEVEYYDLAQDGKNVLIHAYINKKYVSLINKSTRFWNISGVSFSADLDGVKVDAGTITSLISGGITFETPAINKDIEKVKNGAVFPLYDDRETAMENVPEEKSGLNILLTANELGSLSRGAPVYYRKVKVGEILEHELAEKQDMVLIHMNIDDDYAFLVQENTRFWNASGVEISGGLSGVKVRTPSIMALIRGGVCLETPEDEATGQPVHDGAVFKLYDDYESAMERGTLITIDFATGRDLKADSTEIKYKDLVVGKVKKVALKKHGDGVTVTALLYESGKDLARQGSKFWIVGTGFSYVKGITNIDTMITGKYIGAQKGTGKFRKSFTGLKKPPPFDPTIPGLHLVLRTEEFRNLMMDTPVYYRDVEVGSLYQVTLSPDKMFVDLHIFVEEEYADLVRENTRFWNVSGIDVAVGVGGMEAEMKPLANYVWGGLSFITPGFDENAAKVKDGTVFKLYNSFRDAREKGTHITIAFENGNGLKAGGTLLKYKGMIIGKVKEVTFTEDKNKVLATALIYTEYEDFTKQGTRFWLVGPKVDWLDGVSGLETIIAGQYIQVAPGDGPDTTTSFVALNGPPVGDGDYPLNIVLSTSKLGSLSVGAPVYYKQIDVGRIIGYRLSETSENIEIDISIKGKYRSLVRENSRFWNASGMDVNIGFGVDVHTQSLKSLLAGGIAFATPDNDDMGKEVKDGAMFALHDKPSSTWLKWSPSIPLGVADTDDSAIAFK